MVHSTPYTRFFRDLSDIFSRQLIFSFNNDYTFRWWALFSYFFSWSWYARASCTKFLTKCFQNKNYHQRWMWHCAIHCSHCWHCLYRLYYSNCLNSSTHANIQCFLTGPPKSVCRLAPPPEKRPWRIEWMETWKCIYFTKFIPHIEISMLH